MLDAIIVGAGLSGLSAAWELQRQGRTFLILEASDRIGGLIQTQTEAGFTFECGPHTFPSTATQLLTLCEQLGLKPQAVQSAHRRYLYLHGQLTCLPEKPWQALTTPVLSTPAKCRALLEFFQPKTKADDISVAEFFNHRLGKEFSAHLIDPFISGIYAGDIQKLSLPAVFPQLWEWEQTTGSLIKGAVQSKKMRKNAYQKSPGMTLYSFPEGLQKLTEAIFQALPSEAVRLNETVIRLEKQEQGYAIFLASGEVLQTRHIILATPAFTSAKLLQNEAPIASQALSEISYNSLAVVHTGFERNQIPHLLDGFGFLVPRREKLPLLGCIWASRLFSDRAPQDRVLLSNFIGGAHHPEIVQNATETIEALVLQNLRTVFKIPQPLQPVFSKVLRYQDAIPQYNLGHVQRVRIAEEALQATGIALCGNYLHGVALEQCVQSGLNAIKNAGFR